MWYLDANGDGVFDTGDVAASFGSPGWPAVVGNWNPAVIGDVIGVYKDGMWYLDYNGNWTFDSGDKVYSFGAPGWPAVTGKWNPAVPGTRLVCTKMASGIWTGTVTGHSTVGIKSTRSEHPAGLQ